MQVTEFDGSQSRRILIAMIQNHMVCARISRQWTAEGLFDSRWANLIGSWCVRHMRKYNKPPQDEIRSIFEDWASGRGGREAETVTMIERFLIQLSDGSSRVQDSPEFVLDVAGDYFDRVRIDRMMEAAKIDLEHGDVMAARSRIRDMRKVQLGVGSYIEPASDPGLWFSALEDDRQRPLVTYQGAAGQFLAGAFVRGTLYSFMAPDKTGKTTFLVDLLYRATRRRCRVAFFDVGDGDQDEIIRRISIRSANQPEHDCECRVPSGWDENGELQYTNQMLKAVDPVTAYRSFRRCCKSLDALRISCHPSSSIDMAGIDSLLSDWSREDDWRPDIVIIDYADILAGPKGMTDTLDQIDETWKQMRRLSQERHCLVLTATQSSAAAYGREEGVLGRKHFSGRKTKLAHVNGMIGINVSTAEKEKGEARLNWVVRRKGRFSETQTVRVAGNWSVGRPIMCSTWK